MPVRIETRSNPFVECAIVSNLIYGKIQGSVNDAALEVLNKKIGDLRLKVR